MKNVTVSMEDSVAEWARLEAARRNTSVSRLVGEMLAEKMRSDDAYERALELQPGLQQAQRNKALLEDLLRQREQDAAQQRPNASQTSRSGETEPAPTAAAKPSQQQNLEERPTRPSAALQNRQQASAERLQAAGPDDEPPADSTELPAPTADEGKLSDESRQALEQWLRQIPDEPSELLRRKFWYQQQQRQENLP